MAGMEFAHRHRLLGKAAIVAGAGCAASSHAVSAPGNGQAVALAYAAAGAHVVAVDRDPDAAERTRAAIETAGGSCVSFVADVSRAADCEAMARHCMQAHGRIDILHNNVGIVPARPAGLLELDEDDWDRLMSVNLKSIFLASRAVVPRMIAGGGGCITNTSSVAAIRRSDARMFAYSVSKAAVHALTRSLAVEFAAKGIRVNCVMPGLMDTPTVYENLLDLHHGDVEAMRQERNRRVPMQRMGDAWDTARAALFLASDDARYVTGQVLGVDGGLSALAG